MPRLVVPDLTGWILITKDDDADEWHIAWHEHFGTKKAAVAFASDNKWPELYRAVRGRLMVDPQ